MTHVIRHLLIAGLALAVQAVASANTYEGTMTCTVTQSNDAHLTVGSTFQNYFYYNSPTEDGIFYSTTAQGIRDTSDVFGQILTAFPGQSPDGQGENKYIYQGIDQASFNGFIQNHITVTNGQASDFLWSINTGLATSTYNFQSFVFAIPNQVYRRGDEGTGPETYIVSGSVSFGSVNAVPDYGSTALLLFTALLGTTIVSRRIS